MRRLRIEEDNLHYTTKPIEYEIDSNGCWICVSHSNKGGQGYPRVMRNWEQIKIHRYVYKLYKNKIPDGLYVCHKCDVRHCINPEHLFEGTSSDNALDRERKGRGVDNNWRRDTRGRYSKMPEARI